jgi:CheY-like chemotaxis protein/chemotaxis signal transduction protein
MRVLLVDDNPEFLKAAERILSRIPHLEVVGRASSGEEALDQTRALRPELVLMDWSLPGMDGLEATRRISAQPNPPKVLLLGLQDYPEYRPAAKKAGAEGFFSKSEFGQEVPTFIDYLIAQEDLKKPNSADRRSGEGIISSFAESETGGVLPGEPKPARNPEEAREPSRTKIGPPRMAPSESTPGTATRIAPDQKKPEFIETLRENLTALEAHYLYLQRWLEGGGKDRASAERDQALKQACRNIGQALGGIQEGIQEYQQTPVQRFSGPFQGAGAYYLLFEIHKKLFALPADQVLSVEKPAPLIRLPGEYEPLVGLADINRQRVPIIDLRLWDHSEKAPAGGVGRLILVEAKGLTAGLLVDAVYDLTTSAAPDGYPLTSNPAVSRKPFRDRLIQAKDRFLYVWDVDKTVDFLKAGKRSIYG